MFIELKDLNIFQMIITLLMDTALNDRLIAKLMKNFINPPKTVVKTPWPFNYV